MERFSFVVILLFLAVVNSEDYGWQPSSINGIMSDMEGNVFPVQSYFDGQENYAGTEQRMVPPIACFKHSAQKKEQLEQPVSSQNRRSFSYNSKNDFVSTSRPPLRHENYKFIRTDAQELLPPQLIHYENNLPDNQGFLQKTTLSPNNNVIDNIIMEIAQPNPETTTPAIKMQSNKKTVQSKDPEHVEHNFDVDLNKQFLTQYPVPKSSSVNLHNECDNENKIDGLTIPARRFLEKLTYDISNQKKLLERNNDLNNTIIQKNNDVINGASTINTKLPVFKPNIYKTEDSERSLEQPNESVTLQATNTYRNGFPTVKDPTKGKDITYVNKNTRLNLMDIDRVCYACSTENNPTCWAPDRRTTVKYCRKSDNACVTKTFGSKNNLILTRDCAKTCNDDEIPGLTLKHKTCSVCYKDLCNSSHSINVHSFMLVAPTILLISLLKCSLLLNSN